MTAPVALLARLEAIRGVRVAVVGDVMLDRFVHGAVERISPEAPIPVLRIERQSTMLGGCGNVVRNLAALGAEGALIAAVGDDEAGRAVKGLTAELKGIAAHLAVEPGRRTGIKTRYLAGQQQLMRADDETVGSIGEATRATLLAALAAETARAAAVVLSDYGKGVLGPEFTRAAIAAARRAGKPVVVDPKGADYAKYRGASVLTPNRKELAEASRLPTDDDAAVVAAARRLLAEVGADAVLATRGRDGMTLVPAKGEPAHLKAEAREVYDVSGAGDTVAATLAAALAAGASLAEAAELANLAGGIVVGKVGTAAVYAEDLAAALHHRDLAEAELKVLALPGALDRIAVWRRAGMRVGFTNGCFDLLHPGHVALLQKARVACDRLVVGLNSDASVKRLKGPERPLQSETARSTVLASLAGVDLVVVFGEDTPMRLIEAIRPDLLVKGADYSLDQVVGGAFVQGYGGQVLLVPLEAGHSTTATIARMAR